MAYDPSDFLHQLAPHVLAQLRPPKEIKLFTKNSTLVGSYVEAGVRQWVRQYLAPIRVCTGGVIDQSQSQGGHIPQLDTIAWIPGPVPAVFEVGEFALVPRSSCLGILEIKSSAYPKAVEDLKTRTGEDFLKSVTADLEVSGREGELISYGGFGLGVISLLQTDQQNIKDIQELRSKGKVVVLFEEDGDECHPKVEDIYTLINFLSMLRLRASVRDGRSVVNLNVIKKCQ